jgi:hypothetical protein
MGDDRPVAIGDIHIHVHDTVDVDPAQVVCDFLDTVDPNELQQATLNRADVSRGTFPVMIDVLREWAVERARS